MTKKDLKDVIQEVVNETITIHNKFLLEELRKMVSQSLNESKRVQQPMVHHNPYQAQVMKNPYQMDNHVPKTVDLSGLDFNSVLQGMNLADFGSDTF